MRATELAHLLMRQTLEPGDWALDATVGNGHDTLFLAECVGPSGRVFGFDIQAAAIATTAKRVEGLVQVSLFHSGHEGLADHLPADGQLGGAMFNLGYLPGASRNIMTHAETTIAGLKQVLVRLKIGGLVTLVLYSGHAGGDAEAAAMRTFVLALGEQFSASHHARLNAIRPAPELLAIERVGS